GPAHDDPRLPRSEPRAAIATLVSTKCDLIASILNPNRSFSATLSHKSEITGEFVLVFNKFGETIASKGDAPRSRWSKTGNRLRRQVDRRGSWERQLEAVLPIAWHRACWPISPSSRTLWPEAYSIHTGPSSITCADPVLSGMPSTTARPPPITRCRRLSACASSADGRPDESGIQRGRSPHHPPRAVRGPIRNAGLS